MPNEAVALFGEAEKGAFKRGFLCQNITELMEVFGNPPPHSDGLFYATQALLYHHPLIFFRVKEEGFSLQDYFDGLTILLESPLLNTICAICAPGVGNQKIVNAFIPICQAHHQILIMNERDLFDYLMQ